MSEKDNPLGNIEAGLSTASNLGEIKKQVAAELLDTGKKKRLNAQIPAPIYDKFTALVKKRGHSISALARVWIENYIKENE